ncbi:ComF family protein [Desulfovibrio sp.]|uniref:ComF family protein n=1 Tax=Desulfovibrio sp. TaxID=885 RepID=UPI0025C337C4|nr:ComF family protein [Desulfovibrio sp.]
MSGKPGMTARMGMGLTAAARFLGFTQARCFHCLRPFTPGKETSSFSQHTAAVPDISGPLAPLCPQCRVLLAPYTGPRCPLCGLPSAPSPEADIQPHLQKGSLCGHCLTTPPPWSGAAFHGLYKAALRHVLLRLKFDGHLYLAPLLGAFLQEAARCLPRPDALVAVPQYPDHLRHRGYNQAHELARALSAQTGLELTPGLLRRTRPGPAQIGLDARARPDNVRHSFASSPEVKDRCLWLVDDVMTTGSTLRAACRALRHAGAARVDILVAARTPKDPAAQPDQPTGPLGKP